VSGIPLTGMIWLWLGAMNTLCETGWRNWRAGQPADQGV